MTESWIQAFLDAVIAADQIEGRADELSESAARGLLQWCLNGSDWPGAVGGANVSHLQCVRCGGPVQHVPPTAENGGDYLAYLWACGDCKSALRGILGTQASPGRPADPPHKQYIKRLRGLSHRLSAARSQQPGPPSMPSPSSGRPSAGGPSMPKPAP